MKSFHLTLIGLLCCFYGCTEGMEESAPKKSIEVTFSPTWESGITKATDTGFDTGDQIEVFAMQESTSGASGIISANNYANNVPYTYLNYQFIPSGEGIVLPQDGSSLYYYAIYPYTGQASSSFMFQVEPDQRSDSDYTISDLMTAYTTNASAEKTVALKFNHQLSKIIIDYSQSLSQLTNATFTLTNVYDKVQVDLNAKSFTATGEKGSVIMGSNGTNQCKAILPPQQFVQGDKMGILTTETGTAIVEAGEDINLTSGTERTLYLFRSGEKYTLSKKKEADPSIITGVPSDAVATPNPDIAPEELNTSIPSFSVTVEEEYDNKSIRLLLTGIQTPDNNWLELYGTGDSRQNIWMEIDNQPKGIAIANVGSGETEKPLIDIVFLVDNSGSMSEEANAVAREIIEWSNLLSQKMDIQFGCVGYSVSGSVNGALNITDVNTLSEYLNRKTGTQRTVGFAGPDEAELKSAATAYTSSDECGVLALRFADEHFSFRQSSNRIYVNFTDEPNQPNKQSKWSVEYVKDQQNWNVSQGTIHTVYSGKTNYQWVTNVREDPRLLSEYTGGTIIIAPSNFSGVTLESLPVTGAVTNSCTVRCNVTEGMLSGTHTVEMTILSTDGKVKANRIFENVTFK